MCTLLTSAPSPSRSPVSGYNSSLAGRRHIVSTQNLDVHLNETAGMVGREEWRVRCPQDIALVVAIEIDQR